MKKFSWMLAVLLAGVLMCSADTYVRPYQRKDGSSVPGHWRSDADGIPGNNWSQKGNVNPWTGKPGTKY